ncbi:outer membrane usher protein [Salmonella enterica subsp. enterica serovar Djakarta str. S-1087]|uniref:outer membrane usher protein n=1 Tax=Salmonella enterica TaxID=28901 RepID=UPI0009736F52|nr:outer membrane usher protein [Salmonella enterica]APY53516.1 outer membrane usher protein [Salmonella enterica subsp. enterica serovar Djakarta str. S-1087]
MSYAPSHIKFKYLAQFVACCTTLACSHTVLADGEKVEFDQSFLMGRQANSIDLSRYTQGNAALPGTYDVSIFVNDKSNSSKKIEFIDMGKGQSAQACLTPTMLLQLHIRQPERKDNNEAVLRKSTGDGEDCLNLSTLIPFSSVRYDMSEQRLDITVPQAFVMAGYTNYVDPSLWDDGINAAMLSYNLNAWRNENNGINNDSFYVGLNGGINLGGWHFRSQGNYSWDNKGNRSFDFQNRYVQHDITSLRSQIVLGETSTSGDAFDSVRFRGARLYSESRMLPSALASYAPVVRGVAKSNAKVTITQNGYKIYEATVPPGPFEINNLTPSGYGADLDVTVEEADGSKHTFSQPFSSLVQMMHPGVGSWDINIGQVNQDELVDKPGLAQGTFYYGLNNTFTGYTGFQATDNGFYAGLLGVGMNTVLGAVSIDITQSHADIPDDKSYEGQSYRVAWNKFFAPTNTSLNIAAYRYSTQNYLSLNDALLLIDNANNPTNGDYHSMLSDRRLKNQFNVSLNQSLQNGDTNYGSLYLTGTWSDYWVSNNTQSSFSFGYSNSFNWGSYSVSLQRSYNEDGDEDDSVYVSLSIPLDRLFGTEPDAGGFRTLNTSMSNDFDGTSQYNVSANGNSADNKWNYSVGTGYNLAKESQDIATVNTFVGYESPWGTLSGSAYASNNSSRQYSLSTDGGFVLHRGGLTFTSDSFTSNDTLVVVNAPGAEGANLNYGNSTIDRFGYGVSNSLSPYRENTISLGISNLENDVELKSTSTTLVPRQGAVLFSKFETDQGRSAILNLVRSDGLPVPFAAELVTSKGTVIGAVGQGGVAFVRGIDEQGELTVNWIEKNQSRACRVRYQLPQTMPEKGKPLVLNAVMCSME